MLEPAHAVRHYGQDAVALQAAWVGDPKAVLLVVPGALAMDLAHRHGNDGGGGLTKSAQGQGIAPGQNQQGPNAGQQPHKQAQNHRGEPGGRA